LLREARPRRLSRSEQTWHQLTNYFFLWLHSSLTSLGVIVFIVFVVFDCLGCRCGTACSLSCALNPAFAPARNGTTNNDSIGDDVSGIWTWRNTYVR
jgi:hypothetical protein